MSEGIAECDVVVLGFGGAGAIAAIAAHDAGASVTIVEKRACGGGSSRLSSGGIFIPGSQAFANYLDDIWQSKTPRHVIERFVEGALQIEQYCESIGVEIGRWPGNNQDMSASYPGLGRPSWPNARDGDMIRVHATASDEEPLDPEAWVQMTNNERVRHMGRPYGIALWDQLKAHVEERGIAVHYGTRARRLLVDDAQVVGVVAEREGEEVTYSAAKAVIMTTGGFSSNPQMQETYLSCSFVYAGTNDFAHGDGQAMAQVVGARQWHMQTVCGQIGFKAPEFDQAFQVRAGSEEFIWVDKHGRRYTDESSEKIHNAWRSASLFDSNQPLVAGEETWPRVPAYLIFDETLRRRAPLSRDWRTDRDYDWSLDNSAEIERGWIKQGETLAALAAELGMDADTLESTVAKFNAGCESGADTEFGRNPTTMAPIATGPFYALPMVPMLISTHGGPEHDEESRVLDLDGQPIPRLYAAGEVSSVVGWLYEAGSGHAEGIVFGRIAGENAAHEQARPSTKSS